MYVHIGGDHTLSHRYIVGIFDLEQMLAQGVDERHFLRQAEISDRVEHVAFDIPRSVVVTLDRVYLTPIATQTLRKRLYNTVTNSVK